MIALLTAEWIKIRSLRSTIWTLASAIALSVGLAYLVGSSFRAGFDEMTADARASFDPLFATFYSLTLGQLALVVLAAFVVTGEYSSGTISTSLTAVPRRGLFYAGKVLAGGLLGGAVAAVTVPLTFIAAQVGLGPHGTAFTSAGTPEAALGACLYLALIYLFATGVAMLLRGSIPTLAVLLPLLFLGSQGLGNVPRVKAVAQYLPDQAGMVVMHLTGPAGDPRFGRPYGPWLGLGIMALWTAISLLAGYVALRRRDA
ncbi:ABC transporter permease subunit [Actinoplanes sp. KI2]|uniref:ABC transporter permease subunit n=1 Tax=Actinoplanes sp. KI2 TaxID=2983315 RepID=UPI0021D5A965|nr:ABC transporter permease subunit [Actinoplanes sp. KI2]MCU7729221.1 ABC transporter permease subunit [Actinoplanes sp. KI2]